jgi:competence protein ComEC
MEPSMMPSVLTRFRAYQLGCPGSSFSYFAGGHLILLEGRLTARSRRALAAEMAACGVEYAQGMQITSWDADHCNVNELEELLYIARPSAIECPGYDPITESATDCLALIGEYRDRQLRSNRPVELRHITPKYIGGLDFAARLAFRNTFYGPLHIDAECGNNNSTLMQFRTGSFNVLSLGDVECPNISARLRRSRLLQLETDVMILAHHGAENGFTNDKLLRALEPSLAICSSDYGNQYDHPRQEIRDLLHEHGIRLMTTKTGDVVVVSIPNHTGNYEAINLKGDSSEVSSREFFRAKKAHLLARNTDSIRNLYEGSPPYRRL